MAGKAAAEDGVAAAPRDVVVEAKPPATITVAFPLPANIPDVVLDASIVIVKAKPARGRWRAGRPFTREETAIPFRDLNQAQIEALTGDPELVVSLRVPSEAPD